MADGSAPTEPRHTHSEALWQPRAPVKVEQSVAQYSRLVGRMKIALPAVAGLIVLLVVIIPQISSDSDRFRIGLKKITEIAGESSLATGVRYSGLDSKGQPFEVKVEKARERSQADANGAKLIDMTQPRAEFSASDGTRVKVSATTGVYNPKDEILELAGDVTVIQDRGYEMRTSAARVNLKESVATGDQPVTATGAFGSIQAVGFTARQRDNVLTFGGPNTLVLKKSDQAAKPEEKQP